VRGHSPVLSRHHHDCVLARRKEVGVHSDASAIFVDELENRVQRQFESEEDSLIDSSCLKQPRELDLDGRAIRVVSDRDDYGVARRCNGGAVVLLVHRVSLGSVLTGDAGPLSP
jgi:hypothetical protein